MKVLLLNAHSPRNAGDLAILEESLLCLRRAFPYATVSVAINDPEDTLLPLDATYLPSLTRWLVTLDQDGHWHWRKWLAPALGLWLLCASVLYRVFKIRPQPPGKHRQQLMQCYYDADVVVVIGGGHLYAPHSFNIAFLWLWLGLACAIVMNKPLVFLPQSFGPLPGALQRYLLRWLVDQGSFVATREYHSLRLLADVGTQRPVLVLPDLAFATVQASAEELRAELPQLTDMPADERPLIGFTLMDWGGQNARFHGQEAYEQVMIELIRHVSCSYNARIALFAQCTGPTQNQDDRHVAKRVAAALGDCELIRGDQPLSPAVLKAAYGHLDVLVATRMHSAIFALSAGVPTVAIGYLHKSVGIMEMLGLAEHTLDISTINSESAKRSFEEAWSHRSEIRNHLQQRIPTFQATLASLPRLICESTNSSYSTY